MRICLLAVGQKMPGWVDEGFREYASRLRGDVKLELKEIPAARRTRNAQTRRMMQEEGERLLAAVPARAICVALDVTGRRSTTEALAEKLRDWMASGRDVAMLVGGPDGLSEDCLAAADARISLSDLTFPHPLVRVILAEQLYRAHSIVHNHPYHRAG